MDEAKQREMMLLVSEFQLENTSLDAETARNTNNIDLFEKMIRAAYPDVTLVVPGHHIIFMRAGVSTPTEFASADTLLFDHKVANAFWGADYKKILFALASVPSYERDALARHFIKSRSI